MAYVEHAERAPLDPNIKLTNSQRSAVPVDTRPQRPLPQHPTLHMCAACGRSCRSRIGLLSHMRTHPDGQWAEGGHRLRCCPLSSKQLSLAPQKLEKKTRPVKKSYETLPCFFFNVIQYEFLMHSFSRGASGPEKYVKRT